MKQKKLAAAIALMTAIPFAAQAQVSNNVVKVGVLTDMSGTYSDLSGQGAVVATKMAIDDFIANEKPNFKIEMV